MMKIKKKKKLSKKRTRQREIKNLKDSLVSSREKENEYLIVLQKRDEFIERLVKLVFPGMDKERYGWQQRERKDAERAYDEVVALINYRHAHEGAILSNVETIGILTDIIRWNINPDTALKSPSTIEIHDRLKR